MRQYAVRILYAATGGPPTEHDGRYVVSWNPHTRVDKLDIVTTNGPSEARLWTNNRDCFAEWKTISNVQPKRPDGKPNRPLTAMSIQIEPWEDSLDLPGYVGGDEQP